MRKIINIFYGYEEIAEILFDGFHSFTTAEQFRILNKAVRTIDKLLPYTWEWKPMEQKMIVPYYYTKMEVNEQTRDIMWQVVHHVRKELITYEEAGNV